MIHSIHITGTTTAGKSTLLYGITALSPVVQVTPQATCRNERPDDRQGYFRFFTEEEFERQRFIARYGRYGFLAEDIFQMAVNPHRIYAAISGAREMRELVRNLPGPVRPFNILVRYSDDINIERATLRRLLGHFFTGDELQERLENHGKLMEEAFFNEDYIRENIDLIVDRNEPLSEWLKKAWDAMRLPVPEKSFEQAAEETMRGLTR